LDVANEQAVLVAVVVVDLSDRWQWQ